MKRLIGFALVVAMLMSLMSGAVLAAERNTLVIRAENVVAAPGGVASITLTVEENPGFAGMAFFPEVTDAAGNELSWDWKATLSDQFDFGMATNEMIVLDAAENITATGAFITVDFTVPANVSAGTYTVSFWLFDGECFRFVGDEGDTEEVVAQMQIVTVTVEASDCEHDATKIEGEKAPTCTTEGYTGNEVCVACGEIVSVGKVLPATGHNYVDGVCADCGKSEEIDPDPAEKVIISGANVTAAAGEETAITLTVEQNPGFAGMSFYHILTDAAGNQLSWAWDVNESESELGYSIDAEQMILLTSDDNIAATGTLLEMQLQVPADAAPGVYTIAFVLFDGECFRFVGDKNNPSQEPVSAQLPVVTLIVEAKACGHTVTKIEGEKTASCTTEGYTGDEICVDCGEVVKKGEVIAAPGHTEEVVPGTDAGCETTGLTEGKKCSVCGEVLVEQEEIPATGHNFEDGACTNCGQTDETDMIYGDANGDGEVTMQDVLLLTRYFAYKGQVIVEAGADANGDGDITMQDVLLLTRYFAYKNQVVLGPGA
jgi:hypothetical protein